MDYLVIPMVVTLIICLVLTIKVWLLERELHKTLELNSRFLDIVSAAMNTIYKDLTDIHKVLENKED